MGWGRYWCLVLGTERRRCASVEGALHKPRYVDVYLYCPKLDLYSLVCAIGWILCNRLYSALHNV